MLFLCLARKLPSRTQKESFGSNDFSRETVKSIFPIGYVPNQRQLEFWTGIKMYVLIALRKREAVVIWGELCKIHVSTGSHCVKSDLEETDLRVGS